MHIKLENIEPTKVKLTIYADTQELDLAKAAALKNLGASVRVPGFRAGKAPAQMIEKQLDQAALQSEFLDQAVNQLYPAAVNEKRLRVVATPQISITKFVPFTTLEFTAETDAVGKIKLADYKQIKLKQKKVIVTDEEVDKVINNLLERSATKAEVTRSAKVNDEVTIEFSGTDAKTGEPIEGASGKDHPLVIGSKNFIPGFEEELIGLKAGETKQFEITFPKDYGVANLQSRKVKFEVRAQIIQELKLPKLTKQFAASIGTFRSVEELRADAKKELTREKEQQNLQAFDNQVLEMISKDTQVEIPNVLIEGEIDRIEADERRDLTYRGQTWQEHLDAEGISEKDHRERNRQSAEARVKVGLILGEVAELENITVSPQQLQIRIKLLKGQYKDETMLSELDKPENQRDILAGMLTEKAIDTLRSIAINKN